MGGAKVRRRAVYQDDGFTRMQAMENGTELIIKDSLRFYRSIIKGIAGSIVALIVILALIIFYEMRTSWFQSHYLSRVTKGLTYRVEKGKSNAIKFPKGGPYDKRLGYVRLPDFIASLSGKGYYVEAQSRFSSSMLEMNGYGFYTIYPEKTSAGLQILDHDDRALFAVSYPERVYADFDSIPGVIVKSLLFIENKELLTPSRPSLNPAVEWDRLFKAVVLEGKQLIDNDEKVPGGSTLATQMEKYRHSSEGITTSARDKFVQMISASLRAYQYGTDTLGSRRKIVLDYVNSIPLGAVPGYGEVNGIGDGLYAWYGADFDLTNKCLANAAECQTPDSWGAAFKQTLSLFLAQRRPSFYFLENSAQLEEKTNSYMRLLADNGILSPAQRDSAVRAKLNARRSFQVQRKTSFVDRKAANAVRPKLLALLDIQALYELDMLDLTVRSTLDSQVQKEVTSVLRQLSQPDYAEAAGLRGPRLLENDDPAKVVYSFTLYEHVGNANLLRIQTDNFDQPLNINEGVKLELGSSAKLRTLVTYLQVIADLHEKYSGLSKEELKALAIPRSDRLSRWAVDHLAATGDKSLTAMLNAAMDREYSANPGEKFFTGGGEHVFENFDDRFDSRIITVREALNNSVNLVFIRMMRDIVNHYVYQRPEISDLLEDVKHPMRRDYLEKFADREGKVFLRRFYRKYQGKSLEDILDILLQNIRPVPARIAAVYRSLDPYSDVRKFSLFMRTRFPDSAMPESTINRLYQEYSPGRYELIERAYIARLHPLELWTAAYLASHQGADIQEVINESMRDRLLVYEWLFNSHWKNAQDIRIRMLLEVEAFSEIHTRWKQLGYPFHSLVPSYATAIGSSADRPAALAELIGIIINGGTRYPAQRIQELHFAKDTPYETIMKRNEEKGLQVLSPEIAAVVKDALRGIVEKGTAKRVHGAFRTEDGAVIPVGGKTGTGDNRREIYGPGGQLKSSEAINRTAVFVFYIGDRFYGTITAYVAGKEADAYGFTSMLPVQVLKTLAPKLMPLIENGHSENSNEAV